MMKGSMEVQFHLHKKDFKETDHLKDHFHGKEFYRTGNVWPLARGFKLYKLSGKKIGGSVKFFIPRSIQVQPVPNQETEGGIQMKQPENSNFLDTGTLPGGPSPSGSHV